jgi:hypothetical protein
MNYKNAFKCRKCPQSNKEDGCPAWNEIIMTNPQTGETKVEADCFYKMMPALLVESIKSANVATSTHADIRNEVGKGFAAIARAMPHFVASLAATIEEPEDDAMLSIVGGSKD